MELSRSRSQSRSPLSVSEENSSYYKEILIDKEQIEEYKKQNNTSLSSDESVEQLFYVSKQKYS